MRPNRVEGTPTSYKHTPLNVQKEWAVDDLASCCAEVRLYAGLRLARCCLTVWLKQDHDVGRSVALGPNPGGGSVSILNGKRVLAFVGEQYEDLELWYPKLRLQEAGATVVVAGPAEGATYAGKHGYPCVAEARLSELGAGSFDGLLVPGGFMPDKLRRDPHVLQLVRDFHEAQKLIAAICHGGWIPISAGVYRGVEVTGSLGIKDDLVNAGAIWRDAPVVVDRHFVSSRKPDDLPAFAGAMVECLSQ